MKNDSVLKNKIATIERIEKNLIANRPISREDTINFIKDFIEDHKRLSNLSALYGSKMQELIKNTNQTVDYSVSTQAQLNKIIEVLEKNIEITNTTILKFYDDIAELKERVSKLENKLKLKNKRKLKNGK